MTEVPLFPYQSFGVRLEHIDEKKICWFKDDYEVQKYIERHKLKAKEITIHYRDEKPIKPSKTNKKNLQQTVEKDDHRSRGGHRRSTKDLDTSGTANRARKSKSK